MIQLLRFTRRHYRFEHAVDTISFISYHAENNLIVIWNEPDHCLFGIHICTCLRSAHKLVKERAGRDSRTIIQLELIGSGKIDVSSMVFAREPLDKLPALLADGAELAKGKHLIHPND